VCTLAAIIVLTFVDLSHLDVTAFAMLGIAGLMVGSVIAALFGVAPLKAASQSALVLPFVLGIALFSPLAQLDAWSFEALRVAYTQGWPLILDIVFKSYAATYLVVTVIGSMSIETLIHTLSRLRVPAIFIMLFTFLYRFSDLFRERIRIMRDAARSRAPHLHGWRLIAFYGRMSGNLFVRAYERGEQIHAAMLSRGYDGTLPTRDVNATRTESLR